jgi:hypothetical protein
MADNSITFAVGSPDDLRSAIWTLWVKRDDVYLKSVQSIKVSLHDSGDWRIAFTNVLPGERNKDRKLFQWRRPAATGNHMVPGVAILIDPYRAKEPLLNKEITAPEIKWLPMARYGRALALHVMIAEKGADLDAGRFTPDQRIICRLKKANNELVLLIEENVPLTPAIKAVIDDIKSKNITMHLRKGTETKPTHVFDISRLLYYGFPDTPSTVPTIYDMPLGWENVAFDG